MYVLLVKNVFKFFMQTISFIAAYSYSALFTFTYYFKFRQNQFLLCCSCQDQMFVGPQCLLEGSYKIGSVCLPIHLFIICSKPFSEN